MAYARKIHGIIRMEYDWDMYGICMEYAWNMYGICMEYIRMVHGICMDYVWIMYGIGLEHVWKMHGICRKRVWNMHEMCLEYAKRWPSASKRATALLQGGASPNMYGMYIGMYGICLEYVIYIEYA